MNKLDDYRDYLSKVLIPQVLDDFRTDEIGFTVKWDAELRRTAPLTIRQIRAEQSDCQLPGPPLPNNERYQLMKNTPCYLTRPAAFSTAPLTMNLSSDLRGALLWSDTCFEKVFGDGRYTGQFNTFLCNGYTVLVNTSAQLQELADNWIDGSTRFVGITSGYVLGTTQINFTLYADFSEGGAIGNFDFDVAAVNRAQTIQDLNWIGWALMGFRLVVYFFQSCYAWYLSRSDSITGEQHRPFKPHVTILAVTITIFATAFIDRAIQRNAVQTDMVVTYLTYEMLEHVLLPVAQLVSKKATAVAQVVRLTAQASFIIVPYFLVAFVAFVFGGHIIWGRIFPAYGSISDSAATIGAGFLGDFDIGDLYEQNSAMALIFGGLFFFMVGQLILNLILSLVTGAVHEAARQSERTDAVDTIAAFSGWKSYAGPVAEVLLYTYSNESTLLRPIFTRIDRWLWPEESPPMRYLGPRRLPVVEECLLSSLGPCRTADVLQTVGYESYPHWLKPTLIAFLLVELDRFRDLHPFQETQDDELETEELEGLKPPTSLQQRRPSMSPTRASPSTTEFPSTATSAQGRTQSSVDNNKPSPAVLELGEFEMSPFSSQHQVVAGATAPHSQHNHSANDYSFIADMI